MTDVEAQETVQPGPWFHSIDLDGEVTPGVVALHVLQDYASLYFSPGVEGLSVLDVGAWDGFFSFEAERRGAARVVAADKFCWGFGGWGNRHSFLHARRTLNSKVEDRLLGLDETTVGNLGHFDMVLYNGILYHDWNAIAHLEAVAKIASQVIIIETFVDLMDLPRPAMVFYPGETPPPGYPQNGCGMNSLLMFALLKKFDFETVLEFDSPHSQGARKIFMGFKAGHSFQSFLDLHQDKLTPTVLG